MAMRFIYSILTLVFAVSLASNPLAKPAKPDKYTVLREIKMIAVAQSLTTLEAILSRCTFTHKGSPPGWNSLESRDDPLYRIVRIDLYNNQFGFSLVYLPLRPGLGISRQEMINKYGTEYRTLPIAPDDFDTETIAYSLDKTTELTLAFDRLGTKETLSTIMINKYEPEVSQMKAVAMIIAPEMFRDEEYIEPKAVLEKAGLTVTSFSTKTGTAHGKLGMTVKVDKTISQLKVSDYDAVIFVGGPGANIFYDDPIAHRVAQETVKEGKILAAICGAPPTLARAGVLKGKKATMFADTGDLAKGGATYTGNGVEVDGKIITATGPQTAKAWAEAIVSALK